MSHLFHHSGFTDMNTTVSLILCVYTREINVWHTVKHIYNNTRETNVSYINEPSSSLQLFHRNAPNGFTTSLCIHT